MKKSKWSELIEGILELIVFMAGFIVGVTIFLKHIVN